MRVQFLLPVSLYCSWLSQPNCARLIPHQVLIRLSVWCYTVQNMKENCNHNFGSFDIQWKYYLKLLSFMIYLQDLKLVITMPVPLGAWPSVCRHHTNWKIAHIFFEVSLFFSDSFPLKRISDNIHNGSQYSATSCNSYSVNDLYKGDMMPLH